MKELPTLLTWITKCIYFKYLLSIQSVQENKGIRA